MRGVAIGMVVLAPSRALLKEKAVWGRKGAPLATNFLDLHVVCTGGGGGGGRSSLRRPEPLGSLLSPLHKRPSSAKSKPGYCWNP